MAKQILWLNGSPRAKGNTVRLGAMVQEALRANGAEIEEVDLCRLENMVGGCCSCYGCRPGKLKCIVRDDTAKLVNRLAHEFDVIVLATPIYFFDISAQAKRFLDRLFALIPEDGALDAGPLSKKRFGMVITSGGDEHSSGLGILKQQMVLFAEAFGCEEVKFLYRKNCTADASAVEQDPEIRREAENFARTLLT